MHFCLQKLFQRFLNKIFNAFLENFRHNHLGLHSESHPAILQKKIFRGYTRKFSPRIPTENPLGISSEIRRKILPENLKQIFSETSQELSPDILIEVDPDITLKIPLKNLS